ncbi:EamA family transporter [Terrilactibacillus sp. BCM23-1]|uniref:EamA family transporter n=1 Tax=Terrilactibacillus tamarindi TaxID=2599694 RepID=A0A6N8CNY3_9BACI|nr:DMT family transporter [Terrilactibacillus tamarindi]MTT31874.1 EamA family transporter [Terrilactibacillus tamarindi]
MSRSKILLAYLSIILFALIIGFSFMFTKIAIHYANPMDILAHRFTVAFLVMLIPLLFGWMKLSLRPKEMLKLLPLALVNPFLYFLFQVLGLITMSSSEAGIIQALLPILTLFFASIFLKEKMNIWQKGAIFLSVFGVIFIFIMSGANLGHLHISGILLLFLSTATYATYNVCARKYTKNYHMDDMTISMITIGFVSFNALSLGWHLVDHSVSDYVKPLFHLNYVLPVLSLGILASFVTFILTNFSLSILEASKVGIFMNLNTIVALFAGHFILKENLFYYHYIGTVLVLIGVIGVNLLSSNHKKKPGKLAS